jgi:hypothetical protein
MNQIVYSPSRMGSTTNLRFALVAKGVLVEVAGPDSSVRYSSNAILVYNKKHRWRG